MTESEAIESALKKVEAQQDNFGFMDRFDVPEHWAVREALEKQIPKKIVRVKLRPTQWGSGVHCPVCESEQEQTEFFTVDGTEPNEKITWCSGCGQKLDWSDAN